MSMKEEIIERLERGLSFRRIQEEVGCSKGVISYHAEKMGLSKRGLTYYDWQEVQAYQDAGHSRQECMAHFGFSHGAWSDAVRTGRLTPRDHRIPLSELLSEGRDTKRPHLKMRLLNSGLLEYKCYNCGISEWQDQRLSLELHHIDGNGKNNRLENLQLLCPNCHSQTKTWGGKNRKDKHNK